MHVVRFAKYLARQVLNNYRDRHFAYVNGWEAPMDLFTWGDIDYCWWRSDKEQVNEYGAYRL